MDSANSIIQKLKRLNFQVDTWKRIKLEFDELEELSTLIEENDFGALEEIETSIQKLNKEIIDIEFNALLSGEFDSHHAILSLHAGAGGTEACDWVAMLMRMYGRWAETRRFKIEMIDILRGEEAGVKNVTVMVKGDYAYGYLKAENGVHRLVRISPFDANKRRHTSFASVDVIPEIRDDIKIDLNPSDLKIDTYRASGAGGQHVNVTDSAVRITHLPTGIIAQCQNERSQYQNKVVALKVLKAKLYEAERNKQMAKLEKHHSQKREIAWGSQIRSYVFTPYTMVKDHRTGYTTGNVGAVMDGELDDFIEAYLKSQFKPR